MRSHFPILGERFRQAAFLFERHAVIDLGIGIVSPGHREGVGKKRFAVAPAAQLVFGENQAQRERQSGGGGNAAFGN
jgi:hypothetical protein